MINLNEIFRKCGHDTNQNLQFTAIFTDMNQLDKNGTFKVSENLLPTLYVIYFLDCCPTIKVTLQNMPKETLERFEGLYNLIGYVNGKKYWLSQDKKWTIYMSMNHNWIIGSLEALGTPKDINAWLYTAASSCPEIDMWKYFWDSSKKKFVPTEKEEAIQVECANQNKITT